MLRLGAAALLAILPAAWAQAPKKRLAVFDFDSAAAPGATSTIFYQSTAPNLGKTVADLLIARLVRNGVASVIERAALDQLIAEQNLTNSDRTDPLTAAKLGRILGVDAILLGGITRYDYEDKTTGGGHVGFAGIGGSPMSTKHNIKGHVQLTARLVSPDTAEVLTVSDGDSQAERKNVKVDYRDMSRNPMMNPNNGNNPMMAELLDQSVGQLAKSIEQNLSKIPPRIYVIDGMVADASESGRLILNVGSRNGLKSGDRLQVWRAGKEIRDPASGKILMRDDTFLGEAIVKDVNEISSIAIYQGTEKVNVGDLVKSAPKQP